MKLPEKTVERLSKYRRTLLNCIKSGKYNIFSHELAAFNNLTAVQVRRDIMLIGYSGKLRHGYDVKELVDVIGNILDIEEGQNIAVVGLGGLGKAILGYMQNKRPKLKIVAAFDIATDKIDKNYAGIFCYHNNMMQEIIKSKNITIAALTVPADAAEKTAERLVIAGIRGILNFTPVPLTLTQNVYLEEYDIITSLEKIGYFVKKAINK